MSLKVPSVSHWLQRLNERLTDLRTRAGTAPPVGLSIEIDLDQTAMLNGIDVDAVSTRLASYDGVPLIREGRRLLIVRLRGADTLSSAVRSTGRLPRERRRGLFSGPLDYIIVGMILVTVVAPYLPADFQVTETIRQLFMTAPSQP